MATNNYFGFTHGGTQYSAAAATGAAYQAAGQGGYTVTPASATYGTQRAAAGYDTGAYPAAATTGTYAVGAGTGATYDYGYGRAAAPAAGYEAGKTYYQQAAQPAAAGYAAAATVYDQTAPKQTYSTATYTPQRNAQPQQPVAQAAPKTSYPNQYQTSAPAAGAYQANNYPAQAVHSTATPTATTQQVKQTGASAVPANTTAYSNYDAALYNAATMYVAQQTNPNTTSTSATVTNVQHKNASWQYKKNLVGGGPGGMKNRAKPPPKPQQLHYCDVCKISCAGPQTYREHLEGQKHKKREASLKLQAAVQQTVQNRTGHSLLCELCDVTCTGNDAYAAHLRGSKHQKVLKLHTKLGKPIPSQEPQALGKKSAAKINFVQSGGLGVAGTSGDAKATDGGASGGSLDASMDEEEPDVQPVGQDYIEELKSDCGKLISFNCKLCDCRFNDPNAKEMHMKGRRHRLQYKKKVNPDLVVDLKPSTRQRKIQDEKMRRMQGRDEYWGRRHDDGFGFGVFGGDEYLDWYGGGGPSRPNSMFARHPFPPGRPPFFQGRRPETPDDRHVLARHAEIYPKEDELQSIQRIVSHTERALRQVSDQLVDAAPKAQAVAADVAVVATAEKVDKDEKKVAADAATPVKTADKVDGRDNQLFSFQRDDDISRVLKGVMRVGHLAKGLLLRDDKLVELVVLCAEKPTLTLLRKVCELLPGALKQVAADKAYTVKIQAAEAGLVVVEDGLTVQVTFTSAIMREQDGTAAVSGSDRDVLARGKCLQALAALRHAKWFQAKAQHLASCVIIIRILRDLRQRVPTWLPLTSWAMELLVEKVISSASGAMAFGPGDALRCVLESIAGGILLPYGPGLGDPCEKDTPDAAAALTAQQREDITASAQSALRLVAFRQIHKVLGMDPLPQPKYPRRFPITRKRRRSGGEPPETEAVDGKVLKKDDEVSDKSEVKMEAC